MNNISITELLGQSWKYHWRILKATVLWLILLVIIKDFFVYLSLPKNIYLQTILTVIKSLLLILVAAVILRITAAIIEQKPLKFLEGFKQTLGRALDIYAVCAGYVVMLVLLMLISRRLGFTFISFGMNQEVAGFLVYIVLFSIPAVVLLVLLLPAFPLVVLSNIRFYTAFVESVKLVLYRQWLRVFAWYAFAIVIWILISPYTLHAHALAKYYLSAPFDFIVLSIFLPWFNAFIVLLLEDLKQRQIQREERGL